MPGKRCLGQSFEFADGLALKGRARSKLLIECAPVLSLIMMAGENSNRRIHQSITLKCFEHLESAAGGKIRASAISNEKRVSGQKVFVDEIRESPCRMSRCVQRLNEECTQRKALAIVEQLQMWSCRVFFETVKLLRVGIDWQGFFGDQLCESCDMVMVRMGEENADQFQSECAEIFSRRSKVGLWIYPESLARAPIDDEVNEVHHGAEFVLQNRRDLRLTPWNQG